MRPEVPRIGPAVITMGVFDGVHLGHRHTIAATAAAARARKVSAVALVFDPPPIQVIRPGTVVRRLLPVDLVLERLRAAGADVALRLHFDTDMREMSPDAFLAALAPGIELRGVAMTRDSAFGRDRAGTLERVAAIGAAAGGGGFEAIEIDLLELDGEPVSSSRIRTAIGAGDMELATRLLGARPLLRGLVGSDGALELDYPAALPAPGVYQGWIGDHPVPVEVWETEPPVIRLGVAARPGREVSVALGGLTPR